ncbi:MAG: DUF4139 domain-containing protein [Woeseiaceae bacterium]|nr:DUF4139 domain-containing protein [Woeseiaceae bacterium]
MTCRRLQRELESLRGGTLASSTLEVTLRADRAVSTGLRLHYFQPAAHWSPEYESRLDSDAARLTLVQQATVRQGTDEPWTDVALTLSTSDPSGALDPGTIDSEFLDLRDPRQPTAVRKNMQGVSSDAMALEEVMVTGARSARVVGDSCRDLGNSRPRHRCQQRGRGAVVRRGLHGIRRRPRNPRYAAPQRAGVSRRPLHI